MASPNLLNINVDKLFEQHNIAEIDQIHKKLQNEIEMKKEELRTMVGERYRDLIKAADTIGDMKVTAASLISNVDNIISSCRTLNDQQLIGFKSENDYQKRNKKNVNNNFHGIIVQIKILTSLPEMIWTNIDNEDFFVATQLFIFSRHISTGLQLDSNNEIIKKFPVSKKQWSILSQFFFTIKQSCMTTLEREELSADVAAKCLASILLLENCQLDKLLSIFIQMRCKAFASVLAEENPKYEKAKDKILASLRLLDNTVQLIYDCFVDPGKLMAELSQLTAENSPPTIYLVQSEDSIIIQTLPDIISKFRPRVLINGLKEENIKSSTQSCLQYIENVAKSQLKHLINLITSIKVIYDIKKIATSTTDKPANWNLMCQTLFLPDNLDFYTHFYQNYINMKIKDIVKSSWKMTLDETQEDVLKLLAMSGGSSERWFKNLKSFVWSEDPSDVPLNLKSALNREKLSTHKLLMKSRGYTSQIVEVCNSIDKRLEILYKDVNMYLNDETDPNQMKKGTESELIIAYLKECSQESVSELITNIKSSDYKKTPENFVTLARLLNSIKELCPNLRLCLSANLILVSKWDQKDSNNTCEQWNRVCSLVNDESILFWNLWIEEFIKTWPALDHNVGLYTVLQEFPKWDTITIEEKDEQNETIESVIHVPSQPSFPLQRFLHQICKNLNNVIPQTVPKVITLKVMEEIIEKLYNFYKQLSENEFVQKNQNSALQYYFDIKFVQLMFVGREQKQIIENYNTLVSTFKGYIDPFDFDVFYTHLNGNVKRSAVRMLHSSGNIIPNLEQLQTILGSNQYKQEKDHNILALSSNTTTVTWFPLLPIVSGNKESMVADSNIIKMSAGESDKNPQPSRQKARDKQQPSTSAKGAQNYAKEAAAFFGLDKDWFR